MIKLRLKKGKEESLLRKHPWVFSGAIQSSEGEVEEGDIVDVYSSSGEFLARGISAIGSISVRVLSFTQVDIDRSWWVERVGEAYRLRVALGLAKSRETNCYRLVHGEGDNLPGLVVDIYDSVAVIQAHAVGIYLRRDDIAAAIVEVVEGVSAVYDKSAGTIPYNSGVEVVEGYLIGERPSEIDIRENGIKLLAAWEGGQKTGFFIDQRENRELVRHYAKGRRVLNTFCYTGGFSLSALRGGARSVDSVDSSKGALELCRGNVESNFPSATHSEVLGDALKFVREMPTDAYDLIILDPPAFAKHRGAVDSALQAYKRLNAAAIAAAASGTILFTFSCSQAVSREHFRRAVFSGAAIAGRSVRILHFLSQPADHPISIYHPEGEYLKGLVLYIE